MFGAFFVAVVCCHISGFIHTPAGAPIAHASVRIDGTTSLALDTSAGTFEADVPRGTYRVRVAAIGYGTTDIPAVTIAQGSRIDVALEPFDSTIPREIGRVSVDGRLALARGMVPETSIARGDLEAFGSSSVLDALALVPSATISRPGGGPASAVAVASLRGPDPSETLVTIDGQVVNDSNTGDFDFAQIPLGPFGRVDVSEGLGPGENLSANTIGGDIDLRTLTPTIRPTTGVRLATGSFGTTSLAAEATGTAGTIGYALSGSSATSAGYVRDYSAAYASALAGAPATTIELGSATLARSALASFRYDPSERTSFRLRYLVLANERDVSAAENAPTDGSDGATGAPFTGPGPATLDKGLRAFLVSGRVPLGAGELQGSLATSGATTTYDGGPSTPYDVFANDRLATVSLAYGRDGGAYAYAFGGYTRGESLDEGAGFFGDVQRKRSIAFSARGSLDVGRRLRASASVYQTHDSTFGSNLDGRVGLTYDVGARGVVRASVGTGFRAPLLAEKFAVSLDALRAGLPGSVDANCVAANGNPNEKPEHVTAYELGYGRSLDARTTADVALYRTNLRDPIEISYPLGTTCPPHGPDVAGQAIPINIGNVIYRGAALRISHVGRTVTVRAAYGLNAAFPVALPASVSNPTSGGNLVADQQFQSIPIQSGSLALGWHAGELHADLRTIYKGRNNALNDGPFATLDGAVGIARGGLDLTLAVANITSAEPGRFTHLGRGLPYPSPFSPGGYLPTDRPSLEPISTRLVLTLR